tara:strand:- start:318 stop:1079 length:762 start_codon:yes stop_codon:yes gene_type:complete
MTINLENIFCNKSSFLDALSLINMYGVAVIPNFFNHKQLNSFDKELTSYWNLLEVKQQMIVEANRTRIIQDTYPPGKALRISPTMYGDFPILTKSFLDNKFLNMILDSYYGNNSNKFMQAFAYYDTLIRDLEWVDGKTHAAALHFDPYQAIKFATYLSDTDKNNGMTRVIPGSQQEGQYFRQNVMERKEWQGKMIFDCHQYFKDSKFCEKDALFPSVKAGDLLIFNTDAWHGGGEILKQGLERKCVIFHSRKN